MPSRLTPLSRGPGPAGAVNLSLATAGLLEDSLPLDIGLVVGVDGGRDVEGVLQDLAGAGVDHGPLEELAEARIVLIKDAQTHQSGGLRGNPGDEDDLAPVHSRHVSGAPYQPED